MQAKQSASNRNPYDFLPPPSTTLMARIAILVVTVVVLVLGSSNAHSNSNHVSERGRHPTEWGKEGVGRRRESSSQLQGLEGSSYADNIDAQLTALSGIVLADTVTPSATRCDSGVPALPPKKNGGGSASSRNVSMEDLPFDLFYRFWNFSNPRWKQLLAVHSFETRTTDPDPMGTRPQFNAFLSLCNRTAAPFLPVMVPKLGDGQCSQKYGNTSSQYLCMWSSQSSQGCIGCYNEIEESYPLPTQPAKEVTPAGGAIAYQLTLVDSTGTSSFPKVLIEFRCCQGLGCDHVSAGEWWMGADNLPMRKRGPNGTTTNTLVLPLEHRLFCVPPLTSASPFRVFTSSSSILPAVILVALAGILFFVFVQVLHGNRLRWMRKAS